MHDYLLLITLTSAISVGLALLLRRFGLPLLVGYVLAGMVVSGALGFHYDQSGLLRDVAEMGVVFLLFTVGLEFSLQRLRQMRHAVFLVGGLQVGLTALIVCFGAISMYTMAMPSALVIGLSVALSSTAIVLKTLYENKDIGKPYGQVTVGVLLFQEISVVPMLLLVGFLGMHTQTHIALLLVETVVGALVAFAIIYVVGRFGVTRLLAAVSEMRSQEAFVASILMVVVSAALLTHALGFSYALGSLLAGMMLAETQYKHQVEADLVPFRDLLLGVFFITVGMQVDLNFAVQNLHWILMATLLLIVFKTAITFAVVRLTGSREVALKSALAIAQGGGFSFAILELALRLQLLEPQVHQFMVTTLVCSMLVAPFMLKGIHKDGGRLAKDAGADDPTGPFKGEAHNRLVVCGYHRCVPITLEKNHVVVCGYGPVGREVVIQLQEAGYPYVCIEHQQSLVGQGVDEGHAIIFGNAAQDHLLKMAHVNDAAAVIITVGDEKSKRLIGKAVARVCDHPVIVTTATHQGEAHMLDDLPIKAMVNYPKETARMLLGHALSCEWQPGFIGSWSLSAAITKPTAAAEDALVPGADMGLAQGVGLAPATGVGVVLSGAPEAPFTKET
ncbi:Kef-type potassium/proton antiporter, CPA2 family [Magnetococcus marinus MC-1]|uniref:Kef-type potassium/proton antiporter, CPA2 family n=1 Tax=Magnetococcus marinus (strain ATCC BAA-1437 / JCM 17883 / MC-1) TaxID=156889 RepID=A0L7Y5_MAGMM|nr:cation:proton antiporter [Magnetococcus marinus]ABK44078.1 Kef-type potassium/proton antiporter, CPA2 family [Magnetococcus marinus MC-1]